MYYFTPNTIAQANEKLKSVEAKVGGLFCILHCLTDNIVENRSYRIDGSRLRRQLSFVFDKEESETNYDSEKSNYIMFANNWVNNFFRLVIKNKIDLLSCAIFFFRRTGFERALNGDEIISAFLECYNLTNYKELWFSDNQRIPINYNQNDVNSNQTEFYSLMNYTKPFKSIQFNGVLVKKATELKAAGHTQPLYSGSNIQTCFLISDVPLDHYYTFLNNTAAAKAENQKARFKEWMSKQTKDDGNPYDETTINVYVTAMEKGYAAFDAYLDYNSVFEIRTVHEINEYKEYLLNAPGFDEYNNRNGNNRRCSSGINKYQEYITEISKALPRNRIFFGAPGTGKSFELNKEREALIGEDNNDDYERVTFHPDYSYANFVGTYKPVPCKTEDEKDSVTYEYVPGPFMRIYAKAKHYSKSNSPKPVLLLIEEINRANVAAVFGDVFQLLDRKDNGSSEYPIHASKDIKNYLAKEFKCRPDEVEPLCIPDNLYIWATMNSADQGVFPLDTAFKRRWDFEYIGINNKMEKIEEYVFELPNGKRINWNKLRMAINSRLANLKINEDKLLGPFFLSLDVLDSGSDKFVNAFVNKVLMYIFEDAGKQKRTDIFRNNLKSNGDVLLYSEICNDFRKNGTDIFCDEIKNAAPYEADLVLTDGANSNHFENAETELINDDQEES